MSPDRIFALMIVLAPVIYFAVFLIAKMLGESAKVTVFVVSWLGAWIYLTAGAGS